MLEAKIEYAAISRVIDRTVEASKAQSWGSYSKGSRQRARDTQANLWKKSLPNVQNLLRLFIRAELCLVRVVSTEMHLENVIS